MGYISVVTYELKSCSWDRFKSWQKLWIFIKPTNYKNFVELSKTLTMMLFKLILLSICFFNASAVDLTLSEVKRGANDPWYEFQLNHLIKMLVKRKRYQESIVFSQKIQNQSAAELRKILKRIRLGAMKNTKNLQPEILPKTNRKNSRFNSYRRFHAKNQ